MWFGWRPIALGGALVAVVVGLLGALALAGEDGQDPAAGQIGRGDAFVFDDTGFGFAPAVAVNVVNGNLLLATAAFDVAHTDNLVEFVAVYNSLAQEQRDLGIGWRQTFGHDVRLEARNDGGYDFFDPTGYREAFLPDGADGYASADDGFGVLSTTGSSRTLATATGDVYVFDADGVLTSYQDAEGGGLSFDYTSANGQSRLAAIYDPGGTATRFSYNGDGLMIEADDPDSQHYYFRYDATRRLVSVDGPEKSAAFGYAPSGKLTGVQTSDGEQLSIGYEGAGRVATLTDTQGSVTRTVTYAYQAADPADCDTTRATRETIATDSADDAPDIYCYDASGHVTSPTEPN
jgi:YD repeat-containing protein